jgi:hypothetical protein
VEGQFTCGTCTAMGDLRAAEGASGHWYSLLIVQSINSFFSIGAPGHCDLATGGAACSIDTECNRNSSHLMGTGRENECFQGRCVCTSYTHSILI